MHAGRALSNRTMMMMHARRFDAYLPVQLLAAYALVHIITGLSLGPIPWNSVLGLVVESAVLTVLAPVGLVCMHWRTLVSLVWLAALVYLPFACTTRTPPLSRRSSAS